ncbi:MAG TPA: TetR family transcriptional regulator [Nakamurella sp.]
MVPPTNSRTATRSSPKAAASPALSREAVVDRALDVADREGIAAVSIRRIAQDFDVTPMALYWHVKNKDELLAAMGDRVLDVVEIAPPPADGGLERLRPLLNNLVAALARHPGSTQLAQARILHSPPGQQLAEQALAILADAGFDRQRRADLSRAALQSVIMLVVGAPGAEIDVPEQDRQAMRDRKRAMLAGLPPGRFPQLVECADAMFECDDPESYYANGIDLYLAGVFAMAARRTST